MKPHDYQAPLPGETGEAHRDPPSAGHKAIKVTHAVCKAVTAIQSDENGPQGVLTSACREVAECYDGVNTDAVRDAVIELVCGESRHYYEGVCRKYRNTPDVADLVVGNCGRVVTPRLWRVLYHAVKARQLA